MGRLAVASAAIALIMAHPASAEVIQYQAELNGQSATINTGSAARASAQITVDTASQTVTVGLQVVGLTIDSLADGLVKAPIGPIHLHQYANGDLADAGNSQLAFPLPYGPGFAPSSDGFSVQTGALDYASAVAPLGQGMAFAEFVAALERGTIIVNIHTDAFGAGEINGVVTRVN
jgi:hypothetical protein